jgi:ferric enterobactin receptor
MKILHFSLCFLFVHLLSFPSNGQVKPTVAFRILDEKGQTLNFTSATLFPWEITNVANNSGILYFVIPSFEEKITVTFSHVSKERKMVLVDSSWVGGIHNIVLKNSDLSLEQVQVTATQDVNKKSNSSIVFDRTAIEQTQAVSVGEVLSYLPGQTILKSTVALQSYNPLMLRTGITVGSSTGREYMMNNTFGTAVIIDGMNWNNGADMQNLNISKNGFSSNINHWNNAFADKSIKNGSDYRNYRAALSHDGFDFRSLATENIESIEVIQGVASARYGDYTSGIVNIIRQAGKSPLRARINNSTGQVNSSVSKGFELGKKAGALNLSFNYLNGFDDPRYRYKTMERINIGAIWSVKNSNVNGYRNTLSIDYVDTRDIGKVDPDDEAKRASAFLNKNFRVSNRLVKNFNTLLVKTAEFKTSLGIGNQRSYDQYMLNRGSDRFIATAMETGINEADSYIGYYLAYREVLGKPVNYSANLNATAVLSQKSFFYQVNYGFDLSYSANKGKGIVIDPTLPRYLSEEGLNDRPTTYRILPAIRTYGFYMENQFRADIFGKALNANIGIRGDMQNGFWNTSPRLSSNYEILPGLKLNMSWGVSYKSPSMSQVHPGDLYYDIPLLNLTSNNSAKEKLVLIYTQVIKQNNSNIKAYRNRSYELGINYQLPFMNVSVNYFDKISDNGFGSVANLLILDLPVYAYQIVPDEKPIYWQTDSTRYFYKTYSTLGNGIYTHSRGIDMVMNTKKIKAISTSFNITASWYKSYYKSNLRSIVTPKPDNFDINRTALYAAFLSNENTSVDVKSTISSITHIPQLKMAFTFTTQLFLMNYSESPLSNKFPDGYYDRYGNLHLLTEKEAQSEEYQHLWNTGNTMEVRTDNPNFVYTNIHMRLSKDIGKLLRMSFNSYNIFNIRPVFWNKNTDSRKYYNGQPSFSLDLQLTIK